MSIWAQRLAFAGVGATLALAVVMGFLWLFDGPSQEGRDNVGFDRMGESTQADSADHTSGETSRLATATPAKTTVIGLPAASATSSSPALATHTPTNTVVPPTATSIPSPTPTQVPTSTPTVFRPPTATATSFVYRSPTLPIGASGRYEEVTILVSYDREDAILIEGQYGRVWYVELSWCPGTSWYEGEDAFLLDGSTQSHIGFSAQLIFADGEVCDVSSAEEPEEIVIIEVLPDDDFVLVTYGWSDYVLELSFGCFGIPSYEGRTVYIVNAGFYIGWGAVLLLPDGETCEIWDSERL